MKIKKWTPHPMRENPEQDTPPVKIYELFSHASDGEILWTVEDETGGPAAMTAAEWANLGLLLTVDGFEQLPDWDEDEGEADDDQ